MGVKIKKIPLDYKPEDIQPNFPYEPVLYIELLENKAKVKNEYKNVNFKPENFPQIMEKTKISQEKKDSLDNVVLEEKKEDDIAASSPFDDQELEKSLKDVLDGELNEDDFLREINKLSKEPKNKKTGKPDKKEEKYLSLDAYESDIEEIHSKKRKESATRHSNSKKKHESYKKHRSEKESATSKKYKDYNEDRKDKKKSKGRSKDKKDSKDKKKSKGRSKDKKKSKDKKGSKDKKKKDSTTPSGRSKNKKEKTPPKKPTLPPTLSEINNNVKVGDKIYEDITHKETPVELEEKKQQLLFKFDILRKSYNKDIPNFSHTSDYDTMNRTYQQYIRKLYLDSTVEDYKKWLGMAFIGIEKFMGKVLKFDMEDFAVIQTQNMNSYERLLIELGEKSVLKDNRKTPPEMRLGLMIVMNTVFFVIAKMMGEEMMKNMGMKKKAGTIDKKVVMAPPDLSELDKF